MAKGRAASLRHPGGWCLPQHSGRKRAEEVGAGGFRWDADGRAIAATRNAGGRRQPLGSADGAEGWQLQEDGR